MLLWSIWASTHRGHPDTPSAPHLACRVAEEGGLPWGSLLRGPHRWSLQPELSAAPAAKRDVKPRVWTVLEIMLKQGHPAEGH